MKKLGIVITDGVGYRNYVMSDFLLEASKKFEHIYIYSGLPAGVFRDLPSNISIEELEVFQENKIHWFFRKWKETAHLQNGRENYGMNDNKKMNYPSKRLTGLLIKIIYFVTYFHSSQRSIMLAEKLQYRSFARHRITRQYQTILRRDRPDHLFFTHQRPSYLAPFLYAAISSDIECSSFIFSWDNLASKGRMLGTFKYFLVWSELMKQEILTFYPDTKEENIFVVGTPQFEPYVLERYAISKVDFLNRFGLDADKKIICFSCADATIGANDPVVIRALAEAIRERKFSFDCQLLVRTSPAEDGKRFLPLKDEFPEIKWNFPKWESVRSGHAEQWSQRIPQFEDIVDLRSILEYCDLNINMCSTMSLDSMIFDKPVVNTVFGTPTNGLYNDQRFLKYVHFKKVIDSGAVMIAKDAGELISAVNESLAKPQDRAEARHYMINLQISKPLEGTSKRIADTLAKL